MSSAVLKIIIFAVGSIGIVYVSRTVLRDPRAHGFWRFFAWETILLLTLLNIEQWFVDPFSIYQIISWLLLIASLLLILHGVHLLRVIGQPQGPIENTTHLVIIGAYKYIRHPLYASLLYLAWGVFFKDLTWLGASLAVGTTAFLIATARVEEAENLHKFGDEYAQYMRRTKMFVPFVL